MDTARVVKMIYLVDWHYAMNHGQQLSDIEWEYSSWGPFSFKYFTTTLKDGAMVVEYVCPHKHTPWPNLSKIAKQSIDHVIKKTKDLNNMKFTRLVYSTYPLMSSERYSKLDLVQKAKDYADLE